MYTHTSSSATTTTNGAEAEEAVLLAASTLSSTSRISVSAGSSSDLPPSPLTSFLQAPGGGDVSGTVVGGYDSVFVDPKYHSHYDTTARDMTSLDAGVITDTATLVARAAYTLAGGDDDDVLPEANETLVGELIDCLTTSWRCNLMAMYIESEVKAIGSAMGIKLTSADIDFGSEPPSYYVSVLSPGTGQPLVAHNKMVYAKIPADGTFKKGEDRIYVLPSALEMFTRAFLADILGSGSTDEETFYCETESDCGICPLSSGGGRMECVANGRCVCHTAFYHTALDPGLEADESPGVFTVMNASEPLYAEPTWGIIGATTYMIAGTLSGAFVLSLGIVLLVASVKGSYAIASRLIAADLL
uniref:Uncharacterized protein n=2 Tax=Octactis speculum TaxID=3111310 RepID=A0A7S2CZB3_9STRA